MLEIATAGPGLGKQSYTDFFTVYIVVTVQ